MSERERSVSGEGLSAGKTESGGDATRAPLGAVEQSPGGGISVDGQAIGDMGRGEKQNWELGGTGTE